MATLVDDELVTEKPAWYRQKRAQRTRSNFAASGRFLALTCSIGGLQIIWSTILSNGTPFLVSLGFPQSSTALIWIIAPFCGTFVQPYFGMLSDQCRHSLGRRRPFMLGGAIAVGISLLGFGFSSSVINGLVRLLGTNFPEAGTQRLIMLNAVLWFCSLNIAIQPLQVGSRSFIIEQCAVDDQPLAHAWASRVQGLCSIAGYFLASLPLSQILFHGRLPQFPTLCLVACALLLAAVFISCVAVDEAVPHFRPAVAAKGHNIDVMFGWITRSAKKMPVIVRKVCLIQCFAWMGWFPFLAYYTSYIAGTYRRTNSGLSKDFQESAQSDIQVDLIRAGSYAGLLFAIVAFVSNCVLPKVVEALGTPPNTGGEAEKSSELHTRTNISSLHLTYIWTVAHAFFAAAIFLTWLVKSRIGSMVLIASIGVSWAVSLWVPYCMIGLVLSQRQCLLQDGDEYLSTQEVPEAGAITGFHNAAISAPQIVSALICSVIFTLFRGTDIGEGWAMRVGACWTLIAAYLSWRLGKSDRFL